MDISVPAQELRGARLAVGPTRDVVMSDAVLERAVDVAGDGALAAAYVAQADWDPRHEIRATRLGTCSWCCGPYACRRGGSRTR